MFRVLLINPGSTSTELSIFEDETEEKNARIIHPIEELRKYKRILDQFPYRCRIVKEKLDEWHLKKGDLAAVVGRSAIGRRESGTYLVNQKMVDDIKVNMARVEHAAGMGCMLAAEIGNALAIPAFVAHSAAENLPPIARVSGIPQIERRAVYHVQNIEGVLELASREMKIDMDGINLIIAHLEGGMSIAAISKGNLADVSSAFEEGPFTTERSGTLPVASLVEICFSGNYRREQVQKMIRGEGGMVAYLGTNKISEIEQRAQRGDADAAFYLDAMSYQIAKEIGAMSSVLKGRVDAVILTGKILESSTAVKSIEERVSYIAPVKKYQEQEALVFARAALKVLRDGARPKIYE